MQLCCSERVSQLRCQGIAWQRHWVPQAVSRPSRNSTAAQSAAQPGAHLPCASSVQMKAVTASCRFFEDYKQLESKIVKVDDILGAEVARKTIQEAMVRGWLPVLSD